MLALIIYGTKGVTYTKDRGTFHCPSCRTQRTYAKKRVRRTFTLFFIPVIPLGKLGEYIECKACKGTFKLEVLSYNPEAERREAIEAGHAMFEKAIKRVMILMMMADGRIEANEIDTIRNINNAITGSYLSESEINREARIAESENIGLMQYLRSVMPYINNSGKEAVVRAAIMVAASDGVFQEEEKRLMGDVAIALEISEAHFKGILDEVLHL